MCKNPVSECKPDTVEAEEDISETESEPSDSDESLYTQSSVDITTDSDSDAESASGNRVTPDMVLLLMLKEHGAITEEQYAEKAEKCEDNIQFLIPNIPRSSSVSSMDYTKEIEGDSIDENSNNGSNVDADLINKLLQELTGENEGTVVTVEATNGSGVASPNIDTVEKDESKDVESIEKVTDVKENSACDLVVNDKFQDGISKEQSNGDIILQKQGATLKGNANESNEEETTDLRQDQVMLKVNQEEKQETITCESISSENSVGKTLTEESDKDCEQHVASELTSSENWLTKVKNTETMPMEIHVERQLNDDNTTEKKVDPHSDENNAKLVDGTNIETNNNAATLIKTDKESRKEDLASRNVSNQITGKITKSFRYIVNKLVREKRIVEEDEKYRISDEYGQTYAEVLRSFVRRLDDHYGPDMTASKMSVSVDSDNDEDDGNLKEFALYLNFYSPSSYKYVLETFNTPLPEHRVLCSWYLKDDDQPGLTERAFNILKQKSSEKRLTCTLMFIDIFLKNHGRYYDQVDYGGGPRDDCVDKAVLAYVFLLVSLDEDWKVPIGYIYARNVPAETQAELIRICLTQCHDAGADVVAVTLETLTPAECLGCSFQDPEKLKTTFKHPVCDREVAVWIDPCLALKSARQTLKVKGALQDDQGSKVRWNLIRTLRRLLTDADDMIDFEKPEIYELRNHIAKVGLTTEIFSESLAPALELSEELLPELFEDTIPIRRYILFINMVYSILNSRVTTRMRHIVYRLEAARIYLIRLFCNVDNGLSPFDRLNLAWGNERKGYRFFLKGEEACGFLGFLICIQSFKHLYTTLIRKEQRITSLNLQRLCKVQAEDFVTTLRARSCWNPEYFCGESFQSYYNTLFDVFEKNPLFSDKGVSLEHWPLKDRYPPAVIIKLTSGKRSYDDVYSSQYKLKKLRGTPDEDHATKVVREYSKALDSETDLSTRKNMVGYIAGWIAAKFAKCLRCEACIDALCTDKKLWFHKFITLKRIYAVCLPSEEIFRICWECERALHLKRTLPSVRAWVLRRLLPKFPWSSQVVKQKHPPEHHIQLARAVIAKYVPLRIPAPFSSKERTRIIDMFRRFTPRDRSDWYDELAEWMDSRSEEDDHFDQLY